MTRVPDRKAQAASDADDVGDVERRLEVQSGEGMCLGRYPAAPLRPPSLRQSASLGPSGMLARPLAASAGLGHEHVEAVPHVSRHCARCSVFTAGFSGVPFRVSLFMLLIICLLSARHVWFGAMRCSLRLVRTEGRKPCTPGISYGCATATRMWTEAGCAAVFECQGTRLRCHHRRGGRAECSCRREHVETARADLKYECRPRHGSEQIAGRCRSKCNGYTPCLVRAPSAAPLPRLPNASALFAAPRIAAAPTTAAATDLAVEGGAGPAPLLMVAGPVSDGFWVRPRCLRTGLACINHGMTHDANATIFVHLRLGACDRRARAGKVGAPRRHARRRGVPLQPRQLPRPTRDGARRLDPVL